jgi:hypothetical protein
MRCCIPAVSVVAGLAAASIVQADTSATATARGAPAGLVDETFTAGAAQDLDPVGEGIMIGDHARLETPRGPVHVWTPQGYSAETAITVVYVHGYSIDVDEAWWGHGLPEQFGHASINAMFIACEAPQNKFQDVHWKSLSSLLDAVGASGRALPRGRVAVIGHSGAYRTLQAWARDPRLDTMVLLDAGYGPLWWVRSWILGKPDRRLIDIGDDALFFTDQLHRYLLPRSKSTTVQGFRAFADRAQVARLARERIVYVRSTIGHYNIASGAVALPAVLRILGAPSIDEPPPPAPAPVTAARRAPPPVTASRR